ncbi:hypothetical protein BS78_04G099100 [Paspalum vaginatum]|nr:hypothetical protein BS78_04G099100 [Paspalum vaginatum]
MKAARGIDDKLLLTGHRPAFPCQRRAALLFISPATSMQFPDIGAVISGSLLSVLHEGA